MGGGLTVVVNAGDASGSGGRRRAAPVICDGKEEADAMQKWMVNSGVRSVTTNASCSDGEWRLEAGRPRSRTWASMPCRLEPEEGVNRCAEDREGEGARNRRLLLKDSTVNARIRRGTGRFPAKNFSGLVAQSGEEKRGGGEEREAFL
jgi:hypothetical protein